MPLRRDAARVRGLEPGRRRLLIEAVVWLGLLRPAVAALPYRRVASLLRLTPSDPAHVPPVSPAAGREPAGREPAGREPAGHGAEAVGWAVRAAAARVPWLSTCLVQSLAGSAMLRRRRLPGVVYLGVAKDRAGELIAHSWLASGDRILTGAAGYERFAAIAAYRPATGGRR